MLAFASLLPLLALGAAASPLAKRWDGVQLVSYRDGKCLGALNAPQDGTLVSIVDCSDGGWLTRWDINPGSGSVILSGTGLALDAGENPGNFGGLKTWTSYPGLYQQTWYLTPDLRIAITGGDQCLDNDGSRAQTYQCTTGNTNQIWTPILPEGNPPHVPVSTSSAGPTVTSWSVQEPLPTTVIEGSQPVVSTSFGIPETPTATTYSIPIGTLSVSSAGPVYTPA